MKVMHDVITALAGTLLFMILLSWGVVYFAVSDLCAAPIEPMGHGKDASAVVADDITGVWLVEGVEHGKDEDRAYTGVAIIKKVGDVYMIRAIGMDWPTLVGIGIRRNDSLNVSWSAGDVRGVTTYRIGKNKLSGRWATLPGNGRINEERLQFLKSLPAEE